MVDTTATLATDSPAVGGATVGWSVWKTSEKLTIIMICNCNAIVVGYFLYILTSANNFVFTDKYIQVLCGCSRYRWLECVLVVAGYLTETNCDLRNCIDIGLRIISMVTVTDNAVAYTCGGLHIYEDIKNIVPSFAAAVLYMRFTDHCV